MKRSILFSTLIAWLGLTGMAFSGQGGEETQAKAEPRVDINHAGVDELMELPGIGEQVAKRIVAYREENGPFEKTEELMNVRGIGEKSYVKLEKFVTLGSDKEKRKK